MNVVTLTPVLRIRQTTSWNNVTEISVRQVWIKPQKLSREMNTELISTFGKMRIAYRDCHLTEIFSQFFKLNLKLYVYDPFYYQVRYPVDETVVQRYLNTKRTKKFGRFWCRVQLKLRSQPIP